MNGGVGTRLQVVGGHDREGNFPLPNRTLVSVVVMDRQWCNNESERLQCTGRLIGGVGTW